MSSENIRKIAFGCLAILALVVATDTAFRIADKYNGSSELEIENALLSAEVDSLRLTAEQANKWAKFWAKEAATAQEKQPIINKYYSNEATNVLGRPFAIRQRVFSNTIFGLDTLISNIN